jgi:alanine-glyoxylate transaminase / serine-glyoxylate transaminase / serine-pyruvate transaminase
MAATRRPGRNHLFVPGPTNIPDRILRAMMVQSEDHRSVDFPSLTKPLFQDTKKVFGSTDGTIFLFPSSGTGIWESALCNTLARGDKVLSSRFGQFSHLWIDMAQRLGLEVIVQEEAWGTGANPQRIEEALRADKNHEIKAVMVVHNETATGVTSDIGAVRKAIDAAGHPALFIVDTISSLASADYRHDEWGVDVSVGGAQKGLMMPPGMSFNAISDKALKANQTSAMPKSFFAWDDMLNMNKVGFFPYTPATQMIHGLNVGIEMLHEEGLDNVFARHNRLAEATRRAVKAWGLENLNKNASQYSPTITAILLPEGHDADKFRALALDTFNIAYGASFGPYAGKYFRIGHLGDINDGTLVGALGITEMALALAGIPHKKGGAQAAIDYLVTAHAGEKRAAAE